MTELEQAEQDYAAARAAERIAEWKAMEAKAAYYRYASEAMTATAEVMGADLRRKNAMAAEFVEKAAAIAALEAPAQPLPSVEGVTVTPATEEASGGPTLERPWTLSSAFYDGYKCNQPKAPDHPVYMERWIAGDGERLKKLDEAVERAHAKLDEIDAQTCEPVDPHVSWEPPPPTEVEPDPIVDAPSVEIPPGFTKWEGGEWTGDPRDAVQVVFESGIMSDVSHTVEDEAWFRHWPWDGKSDRIVAFKIIAPAAVAYTQEAGGYAPVTEARGDEPLPPYKLEAEPFSILNDPTLKATIERLTAKLEEAEQPRGLIDPELDAHLERVREQERAEKPEQPKRHAFWPFAGKLEDA